MQVDKNPELLALFCPFLGSTSYEVPFTGMKYFDPQTFQRRAERSYIIRLVNSKLVVKVVFSSVIYFSY